MLSARLLPVVPVALALLAGCGSASSTSTTAASSARSSSASSSSSSATTDAGSGIYTGVDPASVAVAVADVPDLATFTMKPDAKLNGVSGTLQRTFVNPDSTIAVELDIISEGSAGGSARDFDTYASAAKKQVPNVAQQSDPSGYGEQAHEYLGTDSSGNGLQAVVFTKGPFIVVVLTKQLHPQSQDSSLLEDTAKAQSAKLGA